MIFAWLILGILVAMGCWLSGYFIGGRNEAWRQLRQLDNQRARGVSVPLNPTKKVE